MIKYFALTLTLLGMTSAASAGIIGSSGTFSLVASDPVPVGNSLSAVKLSFVNSGSEIISAFGGTIGLNGNLHHEQFPGVPVGVNTTPTAASAAESAFDSHFFNVGSVVINAPNEGVVSVPSGEAGAFGLRADLIGFGPRLGGDFSLVQGTSVEFAYLVGETGSVIDFDLSFGTTTSGVDGAMAGSFVIGIPEPATLSLAGLAIAGVLGLRRRHA